jgi:hypothetical protein
MELHQIEVDSTEETVRAQVALVLKQFDHRETQAALLKLRKNFDYQVVAAALEGLV